MAQAFQYDVFLSHNEKDKPQVRRLAERLKQSGLRVWFDEWNVRSGDIIALKVDEGLDQSRVLVLCLSPNALASGWVALERSTAIHRDPANDDRRFIPLLLAACDLPDTLQRYKYVDFREETEAAFAELLTVCSPERGPAPAVGKPAPEQAAPGKKAWWKKLVQPEPSKKEPHPRKPPEQTEPLAGLERKLTGHKAWERQRVKVGLGITIFVLLALIVSINKLTKDRSTGGKKTQSTTTIPPSISIINNYGTVIHINISTEHFDVISQIIITGSGSVPNDFKKIIPNEMSAALDDLKRFSFSDAFQHASNAIGILESIRAKGDWWANNLALKTQAALYYVGALSLDMTEKNAPLANSLARKACTFSEDGPLFRPARCLVAITDHNQAHALFLTKKYSEAMQLEREAINIYEVDPAFIESRLAPGAIGRWYHNAAWLSANTGNLLDAAKFARIAVQKQPCEMTVHYQYSVLWDLGSNKEADELIRRWYKLNNNGRVLSLEFNTNGVAP